MDEHFNNVISILKKHPQYLSYEDVGSTFSEIVNSPNQDMLLDLITTNRPVEDRVLFYTYLLHMRSEVMARDPNNTDFLQLLENFLKLLISKDPILNLVVSPYSKDYQATIVEKLTSLLFDIASKPNELDTLLSNSVKECPDCFSIKSLHAIIWVVFELSVKQSAIAEIDAVDSLRAIILQGRTLLPIDEHLNAILSIIKGGSQRFDEVVVREIAGHFIECNNKNDVVEIMSVTRPVQDRVDLLTTIGSLKYKDRSPEYQTKILICVGALWKNDPFIKNSTGFRK